MPWADLHQEYALGPFRFVPWSRATVGNRRVKEFLDRYFRRHVDHFGKPVKGVAIVTTDGSFAPLSKRVIERARAAADMFVFAVIAPDVAAAVCSSNRNLVPPTAEAYQLFLQRFDPSDDTIADTAGSSMHAGQVEKMLFQKPRDVGVFAGCPDDDLLQGLGRLLKGKVKANVRERLCRSLEWFRLAHITGDGASPFTKAVMMSTAFEILFQIPDGLGKTKAFVQAVKSQMARPDTKTETRTITFKRGKKKGRTESIARSLPGWWAHEFYNLRSRVVHGDPVKHEDLRYRQWISHLIVADVVFWQCMVEQLYDLRCIGADVRRLSRRHDRVCPDEEPGWYEKELKDSRLGFDELSSGLGWRPS